MATCGKEAVQAYVWPTMERLPVCETHAKKMEQVATAMGVRIGVVVLTPGETCTQIVKEPS